MKILFVSKKLIQKENDGGLVVSRFNFEMLQSMYGKENIDLFEITKPSLFRKTLNMLLSISYGQSLKNYIYFKKLIKSNNYDFVFFNGSLYGTFVKYVNKRNIKSIVFFHNVEKKYYEDKFKSEKNISSLCFMNYVSKIESESCFYSSYRIVLNERDNKDLNNCYSITADYILPITMKTQSRNYLEKNCKEGTEEFCLFIGSNFFANQEGMSWFIEKVVPYINIRLKIVGSISNYLSEKYGNIRNVDFEGYVDDLADYYVKSKFVISPIFSGSGMKTKTVEALSFGKSIIGTDEAFVGIDADYNKIGAKCNTATEFIEAINLSVIQLAGKNHFNEYSYQWFIDNLSFEKQCMNLKETINTKWI